MMNFSKREKRVVAGCVALVLIASVHWAVISPTLTKRAELNRSVDMAKNQLQELKLLAIEYDQILKETKKIKQSIKGRPQGFVLSVSFLEQIAGRLNIEGNLKSMNPSPRRNIGNNFVEDTVEVRLEGISLENLVAYLHEIEKTGGAIAIADIRIQPESRLGGGLNVPSILITSLSQP